MAGPLSSDLSVLELYRKFYSYDQIEALINKLSSPKLFIKKNPDEPEPTGVETNEFGVVSP